MTKLYKKHRLCVGPELFLLKYFVPQLYDPNEPARDQWKQDRRFSIMNELCCGPYLVNNAEQYAQGMRDQEVGQILTQTLQHHDQVIFLQYN
jgi:hypothetical protein